MDEIKSDLMKRPAGGTSTFGVPSADSPLKKFAFGLTQKLAGEVNKALSVTNSDNGKQDIDLEPIIKTITQLSEQIVYVEESLTQQILVNRATLESHEEVIEEFKRVKVNSSVPIPFALVEKLDSMHDGVESNHAKLI